MINAFTTVTGFWPQPNHNPADIATLPTRDCQAPESCKNSDVRNTRDKVYRRVTAWRAGGVVATAVVLLAGVTAVPVEQLSHRLVATFSHATIDYAKAPSTDLVAELNGRIESGSAHLAFDDTTGYLRSVLAALQVPVESQMLVMSKTGIQALYTSPANPRAVFFNEAVTVGYIRGAPLLELAVQDPRQGVIFYTVEQKPQPAAQSWRSCVTPYPICRPI